MSELLKPGNRPCTSCPFRRDVPSGVWSASEYDKLPQYDGPIYEQAMAGAGRLFMCHQQDGKLCAGWVGCFNMYDNFAVRVHADEVDPDVYDYQSPVPLFESGAEAAEHGKRDIRNPSPDAIRAAEMITQVRERTGHPVVFDSGTDEEDSDRE